MIRLLAVAATLAAFSGSALADDYVNGYYKQNGTYVQGHMRSSPDSYRSNNYSTYGNTNPYTGARGTTRHYDSYGNNCTGWC